MLDNERRLEILAELELEMKARGVHAALEYLNRRTTHRFTGIYRFDPPILRNVHLFDRQNPRLEMGADTPMNETYCSIVGETRSSFSTPDTLADERLRLHPARQSVLSYCGVLLCADDGAPFGTLCHFDLTQRPVPAIDLPVMESAARLIVKGLQLRGAQSAKLEPVA